jgi:glycine cleavage system regulatory protein
MDAQLVMTVIAKDRPGLVEQLSRAVAENGGNWLESRMSHLGGQFAGILRVSVPTGGAEKLTAALRGLESLGMRVTLQPDEPAAVTSAAAVRRAELSLVGQDRPGIVRQISQAFARHGVNVEDLSTECSSAPMTGERLFHATAEVGLPPGCSIGELQSELERIAADLMVDVKLHEIAAASA